MPSWVCPGVPSWACPSVITWACLRHKRTVEMLERISSLAYSSELCEGDRTDLWYPKLYICATDLKISLQQI